MRHQTTVVARKRITDSSRITEDSMFRSRKQQRIGATINNIEEAIKLSNKVNNGRMTAIMEMPDFAHNLLKATSML